MSYNLNRVICGFPKIRVPFFGGPHIKDYSIFGSILGSSYLGKLPFRGLYGEYLRGYLGGY